MTCGATGWPCWLNKAPGWRPGIPDRGSRIAGCPLPCCRKAKRGARTAICCGVQPCGSAPMLTARARPRTNRDPGAGMTLNNPPLPVQGRGGANHPHPSSNPVTARSECLRTCPTAPCPFHCSNSSGLCQVGVDPTALSPAANWPGSLNPGILLPYLQRQDVTFDISPLGHRLCPCRKP